MGSFVVTVDPEVRTIPRSAGEAQSTVVPPGKKPNCPSGRFLVSRDGLRPDTTGLVLGQDLANPSAPLIEATFDLPPDPRSYSFLTNDHDLVSLSNGDVFYITGAASRAPLNPKPPWFDVSYRRSFGPGARSVVLVWRSTDGGETFHFLSEMDPARVGDGSGAMPQPPRTDSPPLGSPDKPVFDMGGSDGQLIKVSARGDELFLTFGCVGRLQDTSRTDHFELSSAPLNKTLFMSSSDGTSWISRGTIPTFGWRFGVVPHIVLPGHSSNPGVVVATSTYFLFGQQGWSGYSFSPAFHYAPTGSYGWNDSFYQNRTIMAKYNQDLKRWESPDIYANIWAHTIVTRTPGAAGVTMVFPNTLLDETGKTSHGYRHFFYDGAAREWVEADPILPAVRDEDHFVMHVTAIDLGEGPVLFYWYDVDAKNRTATVRGRLVTGHSLYSEDLDISRAAGQSRSFSIRRETEAYWYGDYFTAGGYVEHPWLDVYHFYPMWVEPDGSIRYTHVAGVGVGAAAAPTQGQQLCIKETAAARPERNLPVAVLSDREEEDVRGYAYRKRTAGMSGVKIRNGKLVNAERGAYEAPYGE